MTVQDDPRHRWQTSRPWQQQHVHAPNRAFPIGGHQHATLHQGAHSCQHCYCRNSTALWFFHQQRRLEGRF
uniref:Uncharacterized protein n=1 Tax=Panagrellus redivivus TaxID=6233 RepID=A0A7E4VQB8_PANRE